MFLISFFCMAISAKTPFRIQHLHSYPRHVIYITVFLQFVLEMSRKCWKFRTGIVIRKMQEQQEISRFAQLPEIASLSRNVVFAVIQTLC